MHKLEFSLSASGEGGGSPHFWALFSSGQAAKAEYDRPGGLSTEFILSQWCNWRSKIKVSAALGSGRASLCDLYRWHQPHVLTWSFFCVPELCSVFSSARALILEVQAPPLGSNLILITSSLFPNITQELWWWDTILWCQLIIHKGKNMLVRAWGCCREREKQS